MIPYSPKYYLAEPFAENGDRASMKQTADEVSEGRANLDEGFPPITQKPVNQGGLAPHRWDFNGILYILSSMHFWKQSGGQMAWSADLNYTKPNIVLYGGIFYTGVADSGPDTSAGAVTPGTNEDYWIRLIDYLMDGTSYLAPGATVTLTGDTTGSGSFNESQVCTVSTTTEKAGQLKTSCSFRTNLESGSTASYNGTQSSLSPGVTGILGLANGGTGNSVGLAQDSLKWDAASKTVSTSAPTSSQGSNGDIWFQYIV